MKWFECNGEKKSCGLFMRVRDCNLRYGAHEWRTKENS